VEGYDRVAASLIADVNSLHTAAQDLDGAPGGVFFTVPAVTGQEAKGIAVAIDNPRKVAASAPAGGATLDGSVADGIAQLRTTGRAGNDWGSLVADTGVKSRQAQDRSIVQTAIATQADGARDSASGVSIDEEMTNMLMYQRAYEGAARVMTAVDEMLDTLVNRLGTVGR
jgi:flagellar hook-associated protein 1 FlgK